MAVIGGIPQVTVTATYAAHKIQARGVSSTCCAHARPLLERLQDSCKTLVLGLQGHNKLGDMTKTAAKRSTCRDTQTHQG